MKTWKFAEIRNRTNKNKNNKNVHLPGENHEREVQEEGLCVANTSVAPQPSIWGDVRP